MESGREDQMFLGLLINIKMSTLIILAGGLGSRYRGDKQVASVGPNDECILEYLMFNAQNIGFSHFVILSSTDFISVLKNKLAYLNDTLDLTFINQFEHDPAYPEHRDKPWGTAHAVWSCRNVVKGEFMVVNADDYYGADAFDNAMAFFAERGSQELGMVSYDLENTLSVNGAVSRGLCALNQNILLGVEENTGVQTINSRIVSHQSANGLAPKLQVSMNCWLLHSDFFNELTDFFERFYKKFSADKHIECMLPQFIEGLISNGVVVKVYKSQERWFGITHPEDRAWCKVQIRKLIQLGLLPSKIKFHQ